MTTLPAPDPMTMLGEAMSSLHELYLSAISAGFTRGEALKLVIGMAAEPMKNPPSGPER